MGKPVLKPIGYDSYVIEYIPADSGDDFDFAAEFARSQRQEAERDFEGACNTRLHAFQRLVEIIPDEGETVLDWEDENVQAAVMTGYCSGIDHFLVGDWEMAAAISLFSFLASLGQTLMQRIQEIQSDGSVLAGLSAGMAPTGHFPTQAPQPLHSFPASGCTGTTPNFR